MAMSLLSFSCLVCSKQARSQGRAMGAIDPPNSESSANNFQGNQPLVMKAKEMRQCKSTKLIKKNYSTSIS